MRIGYGTSGTDCIDYIIPESEEEYERIMDACRCIAHKKVLSGDISAGFLRRRGLLSVREVQEYLGSLIENYGTDKH